ncbi:MAG: hypothetical protein U1A78_04200 [Polyangia bacterium]
MRASKQGDRFGTEPAGTLRRRLLGGLAVLGLLLATSQLRCAQVEQFLSDDDMAGDRDGGSGDTDGGDPIRCFAGTPTDELQLLTRCTEAERVERPMRVPASTWDPKTPLPYMP